MPITVGHGSPAALMGLAFRGGGLQGLAQIESQLRAQQLDLLVRQQDRKFQADQSALARELQKQMFDTEMGFKGEQLDEQQRQYNQSLQFERNQFAFQRMQWGTGVQDQRAQFTANLQAQRQAQKAQLDYSYRSLKQQGQLEQMRMNQNAEQFAAQQAMGQQQARRDAALQQQQMSMGMQDAEAARAQQLQLAQMQDTRLRETPGIQADAAMQQATQMAEFDLGQARQKLKLASDAQLDAWEARTARTVSSIGQSVQDGLLTEDEGREATKDALREQWGVQQEKQEREQKAREIVIDPKTGYPEGSALVPVRDPGGTPTGQMLLYSTDPATGKRTERVIEPVKVEKPEPPQATGLMSAQGQTFFKNYNQVVKDMTVDTGAFDDAGDAVMQTPTPLAALEQLNLRQQTFQAQSGPMDQTQIQIAARSALTMPAEGARAMYQAARAGDPEAQQIMSMVAVMAASGDARAREWLKQAHGG